MAALMAQPVYLQLRNTPCAPALTLRANSGHQVFDTGGESPQITRFQPSEHLDLSDGTVGRSPGWYPSKAFCGSVNFAGSFGLILAINALQQMSRGITGSLNKAYSLQSLFS
jgi:hypothetical protein